MPESVIEVIMPLMGEGVTEATLVKWLKKPGEPVKEQEPLLEVSTDKVDTEIPSPTSGYLMQTFAKEGEAVRVNAVIAHISSAQKNIAQKSLGSEPTKKIEIKPQTQLQQTMGLPSSSRIPHDTSIKSSPLVRKIAREHAIDLKHIAGTGLNGRITKQDILIFMGTPRSSEIAATSKPWPSETSKLQTTIENGQEYLDGVAIKREKMPKMRQLIADHMVSSVRTSAHVTTVFEVDMSKIVVLRQTYKNQILQKEGFKLTYTPFIIEATVQAIKRHPIINTSVDGYDILYKKDINIGCAVALEGGLIVPVIKHAQELSLLGIAAKLNDLVTRARTKKLLPQDVQGGTFSITNPGLWGSIFSNPIINQPQVAILGVGQIVKRPVVVDDLIGVRPMMMVSLTFDHRVIDGEGGATFLATLKEILENYSNIPA